jgi:hypothetical protein
MAARLLSFVFVEVFMPSNTDKTADLAREVPPPDFTHTDGFAPRELLSDDAEKKVDAIEMIGEEVAAGFRSVGVTQVNPAMRYLHASRTIHQLIADRNRAVGIFLAVATLLWTASAAVLNAHDDAGYIIPLTVIKRWCLPFTFGVLTVLAAFMSLLLIRTRVGLIYEVAKMNILVGIPLGRVKRIQPFSIFFILHTMIALAGGCCAGLLLAHLLWLAEIPHPALWSALLGVLVCAGLIALYILTVNHTTSDEKLQAKA